MLYSSPNRLGSRVSFGLAFVGFAMISRWLLYVDAHPSAWMHFFGCGLVGMVTAYIFILSTQVRSPFPVGGGALVSSGVVLELDGDRRAV